MRLIWNRLSLPRLPRHERSRAGRSQSAAPAAHAHDQLYRGDFHAFRRLGQPVDPDIADEVDQLALAFDEEVMVIARIGVEISGAEVVPVSETGG